VIGARGDRMQVGFDVIDESRGHMQTVFDVVDARGVTCKWVLM
jgi:hypothetical protein